MQLYCVFEKQKETRSQPYLWCHPSVGSSFSSHLPLLTSKSRHTKVCDLYNLFPKADVQVNSLAGQMNPMEKKQTFTKLLHQHS
jgi:hypothetical protein